MPSYLSAWEELYGASHVDFDQNRVLPLQLGQLLGETVDENIFKTTFSGTAFAVKQISRKQGIGRQEKEEIELLKQLCHEHIVKVVGSYTHGRLLGLLFWPTALCNLAVLLEDVEQLRERITTNHATPFYEAHICRLSRCYGCITSAVSYLHGHHIQFDGLKPSNILLSRDGDGLWLAGFGTLTDFSALTMNNAVTREWDVSKYSAPEVAAYHSRSPSADIFSLGCIFLEMAVVCASLPLGYLSDLLPAGDRSFQANIKNLEAWFEPFKDSSARLRHLLYEIKEMLKMEPKARPTATELASNIPGISRLMPAKRNVDSFPLYGLCCAPPCDSAAEIGRLKSQNLALKKFIDAQREKHDTDLLRLLNERQAQMETLQAKF